MEGIKTIGLAARDTTGFLSPYSFKLRLEVVGEVVELGSEVKKFKVVTKWDWDVQYGHVGNVPLANLSWSNIAAEKSLQSTERMKMELQLMEASPLPWLFVVRIPEKLAPEQAAPLLCAGVTAYSPLKQFIGSNKALRGGILGRGGVGHLGVIIANAMGHHVAVISSSDKKKEEALKHLGADAFLVSSNLAHMEAAANSLDYILDTVPALHPLRSYLPLLKVEGKLIIVGAVPQPLQFDAVDLIQGKKNTSGSFVGSMEETQEILEFWAENGLRTMIEVVKADYVNEAFERMERNEV